MIQVETLAEAKDLALSSLHRLVLFFLKGIDKETSRLDLPLAHTVKLQQLSDTVFPCEARLAILKIFLLFSEAKAATLGIPLGT